VNALESAFRKIHRELKPRTPLPQLETEFFPSVGANHSATLDKGVLRVRVSDLFADAPMEVLETVAAILLSKLYRKRVDARYHEEYRQYTLSRPMLERSRRVRRERGRPSPTTSPRGQHYNLDIVFDALNGRYFGGILPKPSLSWTRRRARTVLGRYDFDQDVIFVSRVLDSDKVPEHVVAYILFHEMLHVKHGIRIQKLREITHTPAFRREEKQFADYEAARDWLEKHG
jgi:hypothetical protein